MFMFRKSCKSTLKKLTRVNPHGAYASPLEVVWNIVLYTYDWGWHTRIAIKTPKNRYKKYRLQFVAHLSKLSFSSFAILICGVESKAFLEQYLSIIRYLPYLLR